MNSLSCSIFFHNYYGSDQEWIDFLSANITAPFNLFYNCVAGSYNRLIQSQDLIKQEQTARVFPGLFQVKESSNKGKDIGGKLVLMDAYLKLGVKSDYILLLHDKHSPYQSLSEEWKKSLFRIAQREYQERISILFRSSERTGIVASENNIRNELDNEQKRNAYTDSDFITSLKDRYNLRPPDLNYVAGTMFWVRASLFEQFFSLHSPLQVRSELEEGNVTDTDGPTYTHAWERLLCWIVTSQGHQIKAI